MPDAAWYQDPADPARVRWWDGAGWTEHTRDVPTPTSTPAAAVEPARSPEVLVARAGTTPDVSVADAYVPMQHFTATDVVDETVTSRSAVGATIRPGGPFTLAIVLFALLPLVEAFVPILLPTVSQFVTRGGSAIVVIAASVALADWDRNALDMHGYTRSTLPSPAYALIPVLYLVMRIFRIGAVSILFVLLWGGIQAGAYAFEASSALGLAGGSLPIGVVPTNTTGHRLDAPYTAADRAYVLTVAGMEAKVAHDLKVSTPVNCQPLTSMDIGETTTCDVELPGGTGVTETIELQDASSSEPWIIASSAPQG